MRPLHIMGGGLAGLSLARALARKGVPVTVYEKNHYPRHKVCGEFITGLDEATKSTLELDAVLHDALLHRRTAWFHRDRLLFARDLPAPALGLSRWTLDNRLATAARDAGVKIKEEVGVMKLPASSTEGWICATGAPRVRGRESRRPRWLGLKAHFDGLEPTMDLELHLGKHAYAGLSAIEGGRVNVCLLIDARGRPSSGLSTLEDALATAGLKSLSKRLSAAEAIPESRVATAGFRLQAPRETEVVITLGDGLGMIPPFTGHGMALAFQSAARSLPALLDYARGETDWAECRQSQLQRHRKTHTRRVRHATWLHPFLLSPGLQRMAAEFSRTSFFPWRLLYGLTH